MITLTIPGIPPSLNRWPSNHFARARMKTYWEQEVWVAVYQAKVRNLKIKKATVRIVYYFSTNRRRDNDNMIPKGLMDGLVKAGVIADDNAQDIDLDWSFAMGTPERTEIKIQEV